MADVNFCKDCKYHKVEKYLREGGASSHIDYCTRLEREEVKIDYISGRIDRFSKKIYLL